VVAVKAVVVAEEAEAAVAVVHASP